MQVPFAVGLEEEAEIPCRVLFFTTDAHDVPTCFSPSATALLKHEEFAFPRVGREPFPKKELYGPVDECLSAPVTVREQGQIVRVNHAEQLPSTNDRAINVSSDVSKKINQIPNKKDEKGRRKTGTFVHTTLNMKHCVTGDAI
jgi:hypothetical protein